MQIGHQLTSCGYAIRISPISCTNNITTTTTTTIKLPCWYEAYMPRERQVVSKYIHSIIIQCIIIATSLQFTVLARQAFQLCPPLES